MTPAMRASRLLGWVSFAIGAAELLAPKRTARAVGLPEDRTGLLRAYGAREVVAGIGAHSVYPVPALWSRVAGDLLDLGTLAIAARRPDGGRDRNAWIAMAAVLGITVIDAFVAGKLAEETKEGKTAGPPKDYSDRSGFPGGVGAARGAGIVRDALAGKAGGAAAGDTSPAGEASTGQSMTDLVGAPAQTQSSGGGAASQSQASQGQASQGQSGQGQTSHGQAGFVGNGQTMPEESQKVIPEPPAYTPA